MRPLTIINRTIKLLSKPRAWTRGSWARNKKGLPCSWNDRNAKCFCLSGAIQRVVYGTQDRNSLVRSEGVEILQAAILEHCGRHITVFNDRATDKRQILSLLRKMKDRFTA
jgi:hypothetical protein